MTRISQLITLPVYSIHDQKLIGCVENILLDHNKIKYYLIYDEENDIKYLLNPNKIYGQTSDCITVKNSQALILCDNEEKTTSHLLNPINSQVISTKGKNFGRLKDIFIENNQVVNIVGNEIIPFKSVLSMGKCVTIIKSNENEKKSSFNVKKNKFVTDKSIKVVTQNTIAPLREIVNNNILIGRKTTQDIMGINNEIIVIIFFLIKFK